MGATILPGFLAPTDGNGDPRIFRIPVFIRGSALPSVGIAQEKWKDENGHDSSVKSNFSTAQPRSHFPANRRGLHRANGPNAQLITGTRRTGLNMAIYPWKLDYANVSMGGMDRIR